MKSGTGRKFGDEFKLWDAPLDLDLKYFIARPKYLNMAEEYPDEVEER